MPNSRNPLQVCELNHVALHVRDLAASEHFYGEILGLPKLPRPAFNFPGAWFALGSQELHLIVDETAQEQRTVHIALRVDDASAAYAALVARGVANVSPPAPRPDGAVQVFLKDPDSHLIEIMSEAGQ